jgi:hypothetical protein
MSKLIGSLSAGLAISLLTFQTPAWGATVAIPIKASAAGGTVIDERTVVLGSGQKAFLSHWPMGLRVSTWGTGGSPTNVGTTTRIRCLDARGAGHELNTAPHR